MGSLEVHAEYDDGEVHRHLGFRRAARNYPLFGVLGVPGFARYARDVLGDRRVRVRSEADLPHDVCREIEARASQAADDDETTVRHLRFAVLDAAFWDEAVVDASEYVHDHRDHAKFRVDGTVRKSTPYDAWHRQYLAKSGFRCLSHGEMDAFIERHPELADEPHPQGHKVFTLVKSPSRDTFADVLGFREVLDWLRSLAATHPRLRVVLFVET